MAGGWTLLVLDLDECVAYDDPEDPLCINGQCKNTNGSYECLCYDGFKQLATGIECEDINECAADFNICGPDGMCVNTQGSYKCFCDEGFIPSNGVATFRMDDNVKCSYVFILIWTPRVKIWT
ncbi:adhesion G protein-coupled receptor E2-like [Synchiropus splendidus]|uniref:adhesion G protein-coupled receptor E2-like n=1 Tax=Synchiropus splendidus TaxID=270530 RepID=UPI00237E64B6|nr:adhesion G protein-coupled receptor E2-like [Synchiropus splendidus]